MRRLLARARCAITGHRWGEEVHDRRGFSKSTCERCTKSRFRDWTGGQWFEESSALDPHQHILWIVLIALAFVAVVLL